MGKFAFHPYPNNSFKSAYDIFIRSKQFNLAASFFFDSFDNIEIILVIPLRSLFKSYSQIRAINIFMDDSPPATFHDTL